VWHAFDPDRVESDLRSLSLLGHRIVRTHLPWDVFMPSPSGLDTSALRHLERFLTLAGAQSLRAVPVLFVQSIGDCVMLPPFAIDVSRPRPGVRALSGGVVQTGGPRDAYTDPRMLEAELLMLERLLSAFAGHPALAWWDLGHDPASTVRPRRIAHLRDWVKVMSERVHQDGERCGLTLGAGDVVTARGVRLAAVADAVDVLALDIDAQTLPLRERPIDARTAAFLLQFAERLSGVEALHMHIAVCERTEHGDTEDCDDPVDTARYAADAVSALAESGCGGLFAVQWSCAGERGWDSPPFDRAPRLTRRGVVNADGSPTHFGQAWSLAITREHELQRGAPWPSHIDVDDYYANLPESLDDLYAAWKRERLVDPAMLG
jgi:hypothetical protein